MNKFTTQIKTPLDKKEQEFVDMESMARIIKNLSNDVIDFKKMAYENMTRNTTKPPFRCYQNPLNSKTLTPSKEMHLGQLINYISLSKNNADDPKEEASDPEVDVELSNEENPEQDPFQETSINML